MRSNRRGFTLIELIVTASIVAALSAIAVIVFSNISKTNRDQQRKADLTRIRTALEVYYTRFGKYPDENFDGTAPNGHCDSSRGKQHPASGGDCTPSGPGLTNNWFFSGGADKASDLTALINENILTALPIDPVNNVVNSRLFVYLFEPDKTGEGSPACGGTSPATCRYALQALMENHPLQSGGTGVCIYTVVGGMPGKVGQSNQWIDLSANDCVGYVRPESWVAAPAVPCCKQ